MRAWLLVIGWLLISASSRAEPQLPEGFVAEEVLSGINAATALTVAPDGRVFVAEQTGKVLVIKNGVAVDEPAIDLADRIDTLWERGLIGMTLHPDFPQSPYVYVVKVAREPHSHHVISRFTILGDSFDPESELVLLRAEDQANLKMSRKGGHQGGPIAFGPDGMLYIGLGELTAKAPSQSLETVYGKILRIAPDGSIPEDNPFYEEATGINRAIYALGTRNPFGLAFDPANGSLYETNVGASSFEEINVIEAGKNYGWPKAEGFSDNTSFQNPVHAYPPAIGRSICGAMFYPQNASFPEQWWGKFFFVDWASNWVKAIDPENPEKLISFASGFKSPVGIAAAPEGSVYVLNRNTLWRDGKKFASDSGSLIRISYAGADQAPKAPSPFPESLAKTGYLQDAENLTWREDFHAFSLNAPVWHPGTQTRLWISIPEDQQVTPHATDLWTFPTGTVVIRHHETEEGLRMETEIYEASGKPGDWNVAAYRWDENQATAPLVESTDIINLPGQDLRWLSSGPMQSWRQEFAIVGFSLPLKTSQLNAGNQLNDWHQRGWIPDAFETGRSEWPRLAGLKNESALIEHRVRSYMDSNCANCHRPGGPSRGHFDARFQTPLEDQGLIDGALLAGDLGIPGARVVVKGSPESSILYQRMIRHDAMRMPPVAVNMLESPVVPLMEQWIRELGENQGPETSFWYGDRQEFGRLGHPQRWINILGEISKPDQVQKMAFRLNGEIWRPLSFHEDRKRIARDGDFNVEILHEEFTEGENTVEIQATLLDGESIETAMTVLYSDPETPWPLPYEIRWSEVDDIQDVAQVIDGKWDLTENGVRSVERYYDRVIAFGDDTWVNCEVTTTVTIHALTPPKQGPNTTGVTHAAIALRWPGHDPDGKQPTVKWHPLGATAEFRLGKDLQQGRWRIFDGRKGKGMYIESSNRRQLEFETPYRMKHRVETLDDGRSWYRVRFWKDGEDEPQTWDLERFEANDTPAGSALIIAHHSDVTFGDVKVVPLK